MEREVKRNATYIINIVHVADTTPWSALQVDHVIPQVM